LSEHNLKNAPVLRVRGLQKSYHDGEMEHAVLRDLDLEIAAGECVALLGRSGSGKSTLLNLLAGIDKPNRGEVLILGVTQNDMRLLKIFKEDELDFSPGEGFQGKLEKIIHAGAQRN